ncbi:hypothetical protein IQ264_19125 [Phormidium sp. LEGE 05292]|uniref:hypothetical protein n=1 Tax=[Phormidium] sp. LEGE 05292 TaxID=767427 RepID=UPI0018830BD9|nr:hypothetical protein [Phormidium sp. LEGE 05292]MBE9227545.1 hypothetical protein [Phormidium sp. LEGE 05292]
MGEKVKVSCKIPQEWQAKIELLAKERKTQPSKIFYEALGQYLGENANTDDSRLNVLEVEVTMLKRQLAELTIVVKNRQSSSLGMVEKFQPNTDEDDDFIEDEPDEILYDFLPPEER